MLAAKTTVPVLGVPVSSRHLSGQDSLYSIVQMPAGVPTATFAIGEAGATNAALFAVAMLAGDDDGLRQRLDEYRAGRRRRCGLDHAAADVNGRATTVVVPPATVGMLGGGQLGRYALMSAAAMGYRTIVLDPDPEAPAAVVAAEHLVAAYDDAAALDQLEQRCDVVTTEFENPRRAHSRGSPARRRCGRVLRRSPSHRIGSPRSGS